MNCLEYEVKEMVGNMIEMLSNLTEQMNDWERKFFESAASEFNYSGWLSERQIEVLTKICNKFY